MLRIAYPNNWFLSPDFLIYFWVVCLLWLELLVAIHVAWPVMALRKKHGCGPRSQESCASCISSNFCMKSRNSGTINKSAKASKFGFSCQSWKLKVFWLELPAGINAVWTVMALWKKHGWGLLSQESCTSCSTSNFCMNSKSCGTINKSAKGSSFPNLCPLHLLPNRRMESRVGWKS